MILVVRLPQIICQREGASRRHLISWPYVSRVARRRGKRHTGEMFADDARPRSRRARSSQHALWRDLAILTPAESRPRSLEGGTKRSPNLPAHDLFVCQDIEPGARAANDLRSTRCQRDKSA